MSEISGKKRYWNKKTEFIFEIKDSLFWSRNNTRTENAVRVNMTQSRNGGLFEIWVVCTLISWKAQVRDGIFLTVYRDWKRPKKLRRAGEGDATVQTGG